MNVIFTKTGERRYSVRVERDRAPALWIRSAPGYDDYLPHDVLHFVAEAEFGLDGAVFGDLAAAGTRASSYRSTRRSSRRCGASSGTHRHRLPDGRLSEQLAAALEAAWRNRLAGTRADEARIEAVVPKLDELARRWHGLQLGESLALTWPRPEGRRRHNRAA